MGTWDFTSGMYASGFGRPEDGCTNCSLEGSRAVFTSSEGWELYLERFGLDSDQGLGDVYLMDVTGPDGPTVVVDDLAGYVCRAEDLEANASRFSGVVSCELPHPADGSLPNGIRIEFEALP
jgi:hypothetical protein